MTESYRINLLINMPELFVAYINKNIFLCDNFSVHNYESRMSNLLMNFTLIYSLILESLLSVRSTLSSNTVFMIDMFFSISVIRHTNHNSVFSHSILF